MVLIIFLAILEAKNYAKTSMIDDVVVVVFAYLTIKVTCVQIAYDDAGWVEEVVKRQFCLASVSPAACQFWSQSYKIQQKS